jgi:4-carboxymuconolactone decarboxylase
VTERHVLEPGREAVIDVCAAIASRDSGAIESRLRYAARVADPTAVEEALLQAHLFVGFPVALEALMLWRTLSESRPPEDAPEEPALWEERGVEVCREVYGRNYDKLRQNVATLHPDFDRWMVVGGYGRVIGRPGLDLATRELCIAALLAVWGAPRQLHSHLRGALNVGASPEEVGAAVEIACRHLDVQRSDEVRALWGEISGSG